MRVAFGVPALALRGAVLIVGGVGVLVLNDYPVWQILGALSFLLGAVLPQSLAAWGGAACIALGIGLSEPSGWRTALALLLIHFVHVLASACLVIPVLSRVHPRALLPTLKRFLLVEVIAQPLALLVVLLPVVGDGGVAWLAPVGAVVVIGLAALFLRTQSRS